MISTVPGRLSWVKTDESVIPGIATFNTSLVTCSLASFPNTPHLHVIYPIMMIKKSSIILANTDKKSIVPFHSSYFVRQITFLFSHLPLRKRSVKPIARSVQSANIPIQTAIGPKP